MLIKEASISTIACLILRTPFESHSISLYNTYLKPLGIDIPEQVVNKVLKDIECREEFLRRMS